MAFTPLREFEEPDGDVSVWIGITEEMAARLSAGAALVYAIYYHPGAAELLKHFNSGASEAYGYACKAYGLGGR